MSARQSPISSCNAVRRGVSPAAETMLGSALRSSNKLTSTSLSRATVRSNDGWRGPEIVGAFPGGVAGGLRAVGLVPLKGHADGLGEMI